jgi:hypothetical protein
MEESPGADSQGIDRAARRLQDGLWKAGFHAALDPGVAIPALGKGHGGEFNPRVFPSRKSVDSGHAVTGERYVRSKKCKEWRNPATLRLTGESFC